MSQLALVPCCINATNITMKEQQLIDCSYESLQEYSFEDNQEVSLKGAYILDDAEQFAFFEEIDSRGSTLGGEEDEEVCPEESLLDLTIPNLCICNFREAIEAKRLREVKFLKVILSNFAAKGKAITLEPEGTVTHSCIC